MHDRIRQRRLERASVISAADAQLVIQTAVSQVCVELSRLDAIEGHDRWAPVRAALARLEKELAHADRPGIEAHVDVQILKAAFCRISQAIEQVHGAAR